MRFGLYLPNFDCTGDPRSVVELARRAEAAGWDGLFVWDDLVAEPPPVLDPWVTLGAVAAVTERLALGPMIVPLARRRPQRVALEAATLERLAPGRVIVGVGMGAPRDFTSFGEDAAWRVRAGKIEAALAFMRGAWAGGMVGDDGEEQGRYTAEPLEIPVWVSGEWPRKREFHGVEFADGVFPIGRDESGSYVPLPPDVIRACRATLPERARADFAVWGWNDRGEIPFEEYERAGATWWMAEMWGKPYEEVVAIVAAGPAALRAS